MPILNKDTLYYLGTPGSGEPFKEVRNDPFVWQSYEDSNDLVYAFEFGNGAAFSTFPLDTLLTIEQIDQIRNSEAKLVLLNSHEAFHYLVKDIYNDIVFKYNIPPEQITLISESADVAAHINRVSSELNTKPMQSRWVRRFEFDTMVNMIEMVLRQAGDPHATFDLPNERIVNTLEDKEYKKKYLCFNRRWRGHRTVLVALLHATKILEKGHVSLAPADDYRTWQMVTKRNKIYMENNEEAISLLESIEDELLNNFPALYLDTTDLVTNRALLTEDTNYLYNETYFSVVTETFFFNRERPEDYGRFLSEKTFKPVIMRHPFIIVSVPYFLDKFKELGYKSFSPWIDESYDTETDDAKRMMMIVREIERLSNLSEDELKEFLSAIREICEHNYQLLVGKHMTNNFITGIL